MNRYKDEVTFDRTCADGVIRKAQTIRFIDRKYDKDKSQIHIVTVGQDLLMLASQYYGDFTKWTLIADKNPSIDNPFELPIGMELIIPDL